MKKELLVVFSIFMILMLLVVPVSAGLLGDINNFFKKLFGIGEEFIEEEVGELATLPPGENKLLSHYEFEDNVLDTQGNNPASIVGDENYNEGVFGQAFYFDGQNHVKADINDWNTIGFSVSLWVKADSENQAS